MRESVNETSTGRAALIAAIGLLIMTITAPIANFAIVGKLVVPGNAVQTFDNIVSSEGLFRLTIFIFLVVALLDVVVAWALYIFLKPVNKSLSLLTAWFRIIYAALLVAALFDLLNVLQLVGGAGDYASVETNRIQIQTMFLIRSFTQSWEFGLVVFGFHLLLLGYLTLKAGYMRRVLGILLIVASAGYLIDGFGKIFSSNYAVNIAAFTFIGEVLLMFWLLIRGRRLE